MSQDRQQCTLCKAEANPRTYAKVFETETEPGGRFPLCDEHQATSRETEIAIVEKCWKVNPDAFVED